MMVTDGETNLLYLADCLPKKHPAFANSLRQLLDGNSIPYQFLPKTKDIWAVDYMPVQLGLNSYVRFVYDPDYLRTKAGKKTISDVPQILKDIGISAKRSDIIIDGGNIIKSKDQAILCDKVFRENPQYTEPMLIRALVEVLEVSKIIFLPTQKNDFTGHADGMVRFINDDLVLINRYAAADRELYRAVMIALNNAGLKTYELPYDPYLNSSNDDATGIYLNYLEMEGLIILPVFNVRADEAAVKVIEQLFPDHRILTINASAIAQKGGILNCISWNIRVDSV